MKKSLFLLIFLMLTNGIFSSSADTFNERTSSDEIIDYIYSASVSELSDISIKNKINELLTLKYLFTCSIDERQKIENALQELENNSRKASFTRVKIPCDEIKQFIAKRRYKAIPHHTPTSGWAYETVTKEPFTVGLIGSKESTGANDFQDWAYWNRLWLKFDLSSLSAYNASKIISSELVIYNVKTIIGQVSKDGMSSRIVRNAPQSFKDADHSLLLPSDANTAYDYIYHEYNNGEITNKVIDGLKTYGYGGMSEYAKLCSLKEAVNKWLTDGNNGIVLFGDDVSASDSGNRKHIKQIKKENIFLFVDIEE